MSGLIRDTRDQPGLEVVPPAPVPRQELHQQGPKDAEYISELPPASTPRICGLSTRTFWIAFALLLVVLGAAIGGGVGGGLAAAHNNKTVPTPQPRHSTSPVFSSSATSTSSSASTSSASPTTSGMPPFSTQPGTYRIINISANTAIDLYLGGTANGTEIEGWQWDPNTSTANNTHQSWQIAPVGNGAIIILNTQTNSYITAPSDLTAGTNPTDSGDAQVYGGVPGSPVDTHMQWVIVANSDNSISFSSKAYSSKLLDLAAGNATDGTPILLWEKNGGLNQEWRLMS